MLTSNLAYPWMLGLPVLLIGVRLLARLVTSTVESNAIYCASTEVLKTLPVSLKSRLRNPILGALFFLFALLLAYGAARPRDVRILPEEKHASNLMVALDVSRSMDTRDFPMGRRFLSRLEGVKLVSSEFISHRRDDRLGLVVFGQAAFLQSPLTMDHELLAQLIKDLDVGIAGDGTAVGDGLGLAVKRLRDISGDTKAIILLTDGVSNAGQVNPLQAARIAKELKIKIHTIGIGSADAAPANFLSPMPASGPEFDEKTLREIAKISGGTYFNAKNAEGLRGVYEEIDRLEKTAHTEPERSLIQEDFQPWAAGALICFMLLMILRQGIFLKVPA